MNSRARSGDTRYLPGIRVNDEYTSTQLWEPQKLSPA